MHFNATLFAVRFPMLFCNCCECYCQRMVYLACDSNCCRLLLHPKVLQVLIKVLRSLKKIHTYNEPTSSNIKRFQHFMPFNRELQRIQAISRGPIYSQFHETLEGISTIRAFRDQERFTGRMLATLDAHNRADLFINVGNRWLSISLVSGF